MYSFFVVWRLLPPCQLQEQEGAIENEYGQLLEFNRGTDYKIDHRTDAPMVRAIGGVT